MKNTIIYLGGFRLPDLNAAAHRVMNNGKILREAGYQVVFAGTGRLDGQDVLDTRAEHDGFTCWATDAGLGRLYRLDDFLKLYPLYQGDVAAVIAYNYPAAALARLRSFCKRERIKLIADCTEWYGAQGDNPVQYVIKGLDSFVRMRILHPRLDGMIAISSYLEHYYQKKLPTVHIPALADLQAPMWSLEDTTEDVDSGRLRLIFAGELGRKKDGLREIVEAVLRMPDRVELDVLGVERTAFAELEPQYQEQLAAPECNICFHGRVPHREVISRVRRADFAVFYREDTLVNRAGFPTKYVESTTCGTPVITTETSDLAQYLIPGVNGFFLDRADPVKCLQDIFRQDIEVLRQMKQHVKRDTFDIRHYSQLGMWIQKIMNQG